MSTDCTLMVPCLHLDCTLITHWQAIALAEKPMSTAEVLSLAFSPQRYIEVGRQIAASKGIGALYMGFAFKVDLTPTPNPHPTWALRSRWI